MKWKQKKTLKTSSITGKVNHLITQEKLKYQYHKTEFLNQDNSEQIKKDKDFVKQGGLFIVVAFIIFSLIFLL